MPPLTPVFIFGGVIIFLVAIGEIQDRRRTKAYQFYEDMLSKFHELKDDPFMSDYKWKKEWIPIFREVDRTCARKYPRMKFAPIVPMILEHISDAEESFRY